MSSLRFPVDAHCSESERATRLATLFRTLPSDRVQLEAQGGLRLRPEPPIFLAVMAITLGLLGLLGHVLVRRLPSAFLSPRIFALCMDFAGLACLALFLRARRMDWSLAVQAQELHIVVRPLLGKSSAVHLAREDIEAFVLRPEGTFGRKALLAVGPRHRVLQRLYTEGLLDPSPLLPWLAAVLAASSSGLFGERK